MNNIACAAIDALLALRAEGARALLGKEGEERALARLVESAGLAAAGESRRQTMAIRHMAEWLEEGEADRRELGVGHDPDPAAVARRLAWIRRQLAHLSGPLARKAARARTRPKQRRYLGGLGRINSALAQASVDHDYHNVVPRPGAWGDTPLAVFPRPPELRVWAP